MKQIVKNYPYPVLIKGFDDYKEECHFNVVLTNKEVLESYIDLSFKFDLVSQFLRDLLSSNRACIVCQVVCRNTLYRKKFIYDNSNEELKIRVFKNDVKNKISFNFFVSSCTNLKDVTSTDFNSEYFEGVNCSFEKNDRMAVGEIFDIYIDDFDTLRPLSSIVTIKKAESDKPFVTVDCNSPKIIIWLNEETFNQYSNLKGNGDLKIYLSSIIVIPALVEALSIYKNDEQEYSEYRWYRRITKFLEESDLKIDDQRGLYYIANQLLRNSLGNSFKNLENFYMQGQKE